MPIDNRVQLYEFLKSLDNAIYNNETETVYEFTPPTPGTPARSATPSTPLTPEHSVQNPSPTLDEILKAIPLNAYHGNESLPLQRQFNDDDLRKCISDLHDGLKNAYNEIHTNRPLPDAQNVT